MLDVTVSDGKVKPVGQTVRVALGQVVTVRGVSDVPESLHVHGYDVVLRLQPEKPIEERFTADQSGVFEIETHDSATVVAKLVVQ